jgi:hypothetical protein
MIATVANYRQRAIDNEPVFKNVLRDMRDNRQNRPVGEYIPVDLMTEASPMAIFEKYSVGYIGDRKFTICDFRRESDLAWIKFEHFYFVKPAEGKLIKPAGGLIKPSPFVCAGAELEYRVLTNDRVQYRRARSTFTH